MQHHVAAICPAGRRLGRFQFRLNDFAAHTESWRASRTLEDLAELKISSKQCQRIAIRIGDERLDDPLVKTVVATRRGYEHLGKALAGEAYARGFNKATSKAFMGDGLKVNWSLYLVWLDWVWGGEVSRVIAALREIASDREDVPEAVERAITYGGSKARRSSGVTNRSSRCFSEKPTT